MNYTGQVEYTCPASHSTFCDVHTKNYNLCTKNAMTCDNEDYDYDDVTIPIPILDNVEKGEEIEHLRNISKNYVEDNLTHKCNITKEPSSKTFGNFYSPNNFSIVTLNAMGIYRGNDDGLYSLMVFRVKILQNYIIMNQPTIICFQEMSIPFFNLLYDDEDIKRLYPHYYEDDLSVEKLQERNKDIEVFAMSKIPISTVRTFELEGNLNYSDSLGIYEFEDLVIFNCYLQAGSDKSKGQQYKWLHYSRCRSQQLRYIKTMIEKINKPTIILGDFNFNLNDDVSKWPEKRAIDDLINDEEFQIKDSWKTLHPDKPGNTEDTDINSMRFNNKLMEKHYRYDAILYSKHLEPTESEIILNEPIILPKELNNYYEEKILIPEKERTDQIKYSKGYSQDNKRYDMFVSDHFGVCSNFVKKPN